MGRQKFDVVFGRDFLQVRPQEAGGIVLIEGDEQGIRDAVGGCHFDLVMRILVGVVGRGDADFEKMVLVQRLDDCANHAVGEGCVRQLWILFEDEYDVLRVRVLRGRLFFGKVEGGRLGPVGDFQNLVNVCQMGLDCIFRNVQGSADFTVC